jgi:hypothetical protein
MCSPPDLEAHALCLGAGDDSRHNVGKDAAAGLLAKVPNAASSSLPRPLKWGPLGPSVGPLGSLQTKKVSGSRSV